MQQPTVRRRKKRVGSYPNFTVMFSLTMALFVIGLGGLIILQANYLSQAIRNNIEIQVYLDRYVTEADINQVRKVLSLRPYVSIENNEPQLRFVSKDEAAQQFIRSTGEDFVAFLGENPLRDAFVIRVKPEFYQSNRMQRIKEDLERIPGIFEATYLENLVEEINQNLLRVTFVLFVFAAILLITIAILINNTIKLAMFSQRFLIRSMQLVGATAFFIQRPFLARSMVQGLGSGLLASGLLFLLAQYASRQVDGISLMQNPQLLLLVFSLLCLIGLIVSFISSYRSVSKFLQMSLDELY